MAAYGLYTHIRSNRRRSIALLIGLFFLVYLMVYAGALLAEGWLGGNAPVDVILRARLARPDPGVALCHRRHIGLDPDRLPLSSVDDRRIERQRGGDAQGGAAAL